MKRKIIASLVAAALGLSAGPAALAACPADGATPFTAGPVNPVNGFSEFVRDSNNLTLELCNQGDGATGLCFFDPVVPDNLYSRQVGFGAEAFWWLAEAGIQGNVNALVVMAAEAAWAAEVPQPGQNFPFTRLRIRLDVPAPGTYKLTHPYGEASYDIPVVGAGDEVRESFDIPFIPNQSNQGRVGPWLTSVGGPFTSLDQPGALFVGDGTPREAVGSPCGNNLLKVEGFALGTTTPLVIDPLDTDADGGNNSFTQDLFVIFGKQWDTRYQTPLVTDRTTYDRPGPGGQVDLFATSPQDVPHAPPAAAVLESAQLLTGPDPAGRFFRSDVLADAGTLPADVSLTATGGTTDPTTLLSALTDVVRITRAEYNLTTGILSVQAASSDTGGNPTLTVEEFGAAVGAQGVGIPTTVPPASVTVVSAKGGRDVEPVSVVDAAPGANLPPFAILDSATTNEDTAVTIQVLANDGDPDGDPIVVADVINLPTGNGTATSNGSSITFQPALNFNNTTGQAGSFQYRVSDGRGGFSNYATVMVGVLPVNDNPVAGPDGATTSEDVAVVIPATALLANDSDVDTGDVLTVTAVGNASNGVAVLNGADVLFTPATNFSGAAGFDYTVSDGNGGSAVGRVTVTVTPVNDPPVARDDFAATAFQTAVTINVLQNDTDPEGTALAVATFTQGENGGGVARGAGNNLVFTPAANFSGVDRFTYVAQDSAAQPALSNTATVQVTVAQPAQLVDLDIARLTATSSVRLSRNQQVGITMRVNNPGNVNGSRNATLTGTQNGVQVYSQTLQVSDDAGGGTTNVTFPPFRPTVTGTILWTMEIFDDNPDVDVATATTTVNP